MKRFTPRLKLVCYEFPKISRSVFHYILRHKHHNRIAQANGQFLDHFAATLFQGIVGALPFAAHGFPTNTHLGVHDSGRHSSAAKIARRSLL
jgi:hypothetical protein